MRAREIEYFRSADPDQLKADVNAPYEVDKVSFSVNGNDAGSSSSSPYQVSYSPSVGTTSIDVKATVTDKQGNQNSDSKIHEQNSDI